MTNVISSNHNMNTLQIQELIKICKLIINIANELALAEIDNVRPIITDPKYFRSDTVLKIYNKIKKLQVRYDRYLNSLLDTEAKQEAMADFNDVYDEFLPKYVEDVRTHVENAYFKANIPNAKMLASVQMLDFMCQVAMFTTDELYRMYKHITPDMKSLLNWRITAIGQQARLLVTKVNIIKDKDIPDKWNIMSHKGIIPAKDNLFKALLDENKFQYAWNLIYKKED